MKTKKIIASLVSFVFLLSFLALPGTIFAQSDGGIVGPSGQINQPSKLMGGSATTPISGLAAGTTSTGAASSSGWNISNLKNFGLPGGTLTQIVTNILTWILGIFGFIGIIGFAISGIMYLTAAGNDDQEKKAKKAMTASIYGVIVGLAGLVVIMAVHAALSGTASF